MELYHIVVENFASEVIGVDLPGEFFDDVEPLEDQRIYVDGGDSEKRKKGKTPQDLISVARYMELSRLVPMNPALKRLAPIVRAVSDVGYGYFRIL